MDAAAFLTQISATRVFAIIRASSAAEARELAAALLRGGIRALEVTFTTPGAAEVIAELRASEPELLLGAGTVLDVPTLEVAIAAGAEFAVSPHFDPELVAAALAHGLPYLPGAFTPTEVRAAWRSGAVAIKLFPAAQVGVGHLVSLRGPFPDVRFVPTGGIDESNVGEWLAAGALAVGVGGSLVRGSAEAVTQSARRLLRAAGVAAD